MKTIILGFTDHGWFDLVADVGIGFAEKNTHSIKASRELCKNRHYWVYIRDRVQDYTEKWMDENLGTNYTFKSRVQIVRQMYVKQLRQHFNKRKSSRKFRQTAKEISNGLPPI